MAVLLAVPLGVLLFAAWGGRLTAMIERLSQHLPGSSGARLPTWYAEALPLVRSYRSLRTIIPVIILTILVFGVDLLTIWTLLFAFGWSLPIMAALTLEVFLEAGSILPSAPSNIGVYQAASILALSLYGIDSSGAVAISVAIQVLFLLVVVLKAAWVGYHYKVGSSVLAMNRGDAYALLEDTR